MKKDIAIITLHSVKNYGSVLQAYATQCYFEHMGLDVVIIDYRRPWETKIGYWFYLTDKSLKGIARNILYFPSKIIQYFRFNRFIKTKLQLTSKKYKNIKDLKNDPVNASIYCTGSDQVWNSGWNNGVILEYFLNFVADEAIKISFAASFGSSNITKKDSRIIEPFLKQYNLITVREKASVDMLEKNFGLTSYEILDPTLQMDGNFWKSMCNEKRILNDKFVLMIQLNRNHHFDDLAVRFSEAKGLKLIRLCLRVDQIVLPGKSIIIPKVEDYVRLIRDSEYVLTDSFHAVSFCLNLEKQFYVYYPQKYAERLKSILQILNLKNRELNSETVAYENKVDYNDVLEKLTFKRKKTKKMIEGIIRDYEK